MHASQTHPHRREGQFLVEHARHSQEDQRRHGAGAAQVEDQRRHGQSEFLPPEAAQVENQRRHGQSEFLPPHPHRREAEAAQVEDLTRPAPRHENTVTLPRALSTWMRNVRKFNYQARSTRKQCKR